MRVRLALPILPLLWVSACGDSPTSTSTNRITPPPSVTPPPSPSGIRGRIVDAVSGAPVPGARISTAGGVATTTSDGTFSLDTSVGGVVAIVTEAEGYWTRRTRALPATEMFELDLLPVDGEFDLEFFDHVFRDLGSDGTHPWLEEPRFEIWDRIYECTTFSENGSCTELVATESAVPGRFVSMMREVIVNDSRKYTGGKIRGAFVETVTAHAPGATIPRAEYFQIGRVTIALVVRPDDYSWGFWRYFRNGEMSSGHVQINRRHRQRRGIYSHEIAHTLGYAHPLGLENVPLRSIMRRGHGDEPTRIDMLHGRILYNRPPNSHTPDLDPDDFVVNALHDVRTRRGELVTRSAH